MQRVLSFPPPSRGFGDPAEFVSKRMCFSFMFALGFLAFLGGFLLGRFVFDQELELSRSKLKKAHLHHQQVFGKFKNYSLYNVTNLLEGISESAILEHFTLLSNDSSSDSASRALREAEILRNHLSTNGFDLVSPLAESQIHLSYPSFRKSNQALILDNGGNVVLQINDTRKSYGEGSIDDSPAESIVEANVVYVNFGRNEDYHFLDSIGVNTAGKIVLLRAGGMSSADAVNNALDHEARGILLYLDPQQKGIKVPLLGPGDLAKLRISQRNQIDKWDGNVPVLEIDSADAEKIFLYMTSGEASSESWRGNLNCSYPIGPGFLNSTWKMKMEVNTIDTAKTYFDVLGAIRGSQEPDRFVILAGEKSCEPERISAASLLMEVVRVMGNLKGKGWRPHRSILIAFWGPEGPDPYLSSHPETIWSQLTTKMVAYLKVDSFCKSVRNSDGNQTHSVATPILEKLFYKSADAAFLKDSSLDKMLPSITDNLFIQYGVPFLTIDSYEPTSDEAVKKITSFWSAATWNLAESHGLPFGLNSYEKFFTHSIEVVEKRFKTIAQKHALFLDTLFKNVNELIDTIRSFEGKWSHSDKSKSIEMRIMNDQLLAFAHSINCNREQTSFPYFTSSRHIIFSKSLTGTDEKAGFGILQDLLREITSTKSPEDLHHRIITHLADLVECVNFARYTLTEGLETFVTWKT